jgi:HlyD family secretion protein
MSMPVSDPAKTVARLTSVRRYAIVGLATTLLMFAGIGGWAATTDMAGAVLAPGSVVVSGNVKKIQHPTGGVIGDILVKNGDAVKTGDLLVRLDETITRASLAVITRQMDELAGRRARLSAERDEATAPIFPDDLKGRESDASVAQILNGEQRLFETRVSARGRQKAQLDERIAAFKEEIAGTQGQIKAKSRETELIAKEIDGLKDLEEQKLVTTSKMMSLRREAARLDGESAQLQAAVGQARGRIAEIEVQKLSIDSEAQSEIGRELRDAEGKLAELAERRTAAEDQLRRVDLRSPVDGIVHSASVFTVGGVINPAEQLMLIVPQNVRLAIEAKVAPHDIDQARSHTNATIRFSAFNQRTTPMVKARVTTVAADLTKDQQTGETFYVAQLEILEEELGKLDGQKLVPGMPVDVQIQTDARSALSYLVKPLEDQFAKAFKER